MLRGILEIYLDLLGNNAIFFVETEGWYLENPVPKGRDRRRSLFYFDWDLIFCSAYCGSISLVESNLCSISLTSPRVIEILEEAACCIVCVFEFNWAESAIL